MTSPTTRLMQHVRPDPRLALRGAATAVAGVLVLTAMLTSGCAGKADGAFGGDAADAGDGDGDGDADADSDADTDIPEDEGDFEAPQGSGRFVYSASAETDRLAVIDGSSLVIDVIDTCRRPAHVRGLPDAPANGGRAAFLCTGSDEVAVVTTNPEGVSTLERWPGRPGANAVAVSPDGRWVIAYHDADETAGVSPGSKQDLTLIDRDDGTSRALVVGSNPREIVFAPDFDRIYVRTDDGVNAIPLDALAGLQKPPLVPVLSDTASAPESFEISVLAEHQMALARSDALPLLTVTDLETGEQFDLELPAPTTDLDVAGDGSFAVLIAPPIDPALDPGSWLIEIALPPTPSTSPTAIGVTGEYLRFATLASGGETAITYSPVADLLWPGPDARRRITVIRRGDGDWAEQIPLYVHAGVRSIGVAPGGDAAILLQGGDAGVSTSAPFSYTLIDLLQPVPLRKLQSTYTTPESVVFDTDGSRALVMTTPEEGVQRVEHADLLSFVVEGIDLPSPPEVIGYVPAAARFFVGQVHPAGRITFVDDEGDVKTATGYELLDAVKD